MIIYKTTNKINGKIYIGQTKRNWIGYLGSGRVLSKAISKYGKENFEREVLCECETQDELDEMEKYWIKKLNSTNRDIGYNVEDGGLNGTCGEMSQEIRDRIRNTLKGRKRPPFSDSWKENISQGKMGGTPWNKGVPWDSPKMWINDGTTEKLIPVESRDSFEKKWTNGRLCIPNPNKAVCKGRVWMSKNGKTKMVKPELVDEKILEGWSIGRLKVKRELSDD
jgi:group I intron endonuclease